MKRGREPATVLRPFFMLAGRGAPGDAERGFGRALSRASGDALLRARLFCSGPRAHLRTGGGSDQREAGGSDRPRSLVSHMVLCRRLFRRCDLLSVGTEDPSAAVILPPPPSCSRSKGKGGKLPPGRKRTGSLVLSAQWGTVGTPNAAGAEPQDGASCLPEPPTACSRTRGPSSCASLSLPRHLSFQHAGGRRERQPQIGAPVFSDLCLRHLSQDRARSASRPSDAAAADLHP